MIYTGLILARKLSIVKDSLGMKKAIQFEGRIGIVTAVTYVVAGLGLKHDPLVKTMVQGLVICICLTMMSIVNVLIPLGKAWRDRDDDIVMGGMKSETEGLFHADTEALHLLLSTKEGFEAFEKFSSLEFSLENIYFWKNVVHFRTLDVLQRQEYAESIYKDFLLVDSHLPVNISSDLLGHYAQQYEVLFEKSPQNNATAKRRRSNLLGKIKTSSVLPDPQTKDKGLECAGTTRQAAKELSVSHFDEALKQVLDLICLDSLRRFKVIIRIGKRHFEQYDGLCA